MDRLLKEQPQRDSGNPNILERISREREKFRREIVLRTTPSAAERSRNRGRDIRRNQIRRNQTLNLTRGSRMTRKDTPLTQLPQSAQASCVSDSVRVGELHRVCTDATLVASAQARQKGLAEPLFTAIGVHSASSEASTRFDTDIRIHAKHRQ